METRLSECGAEASREAPFPARRSSTKRLHSDFLDMTQGGAMKGLFADHIDLSAQVMQLRQKRQNVVAGNLANIGNPNYKARRFEFEEQLQQALQTGLGGRLTKTDPEHLPTGLDQARVKGDLSQETEFRVIQGEDAVDLDKEMAVQAENSLLYNVLAKVLQKSFSGLSETITKGGR
jgi:flagellar basal-body rod protein FlgB